MLQNWVASEGDAWTLTVDAATRYLERVLAERTNLDGTAPAFSPHLLENDIQTAPTLVQALAPIIQVFMVWYVILPTMFLPRDPTSTGLPSRHAF